MPSRTHDLLQAGYRYALALRCKNEDARDLVHEAWVRLNSQVIPLVTKSRLFLTIRNIYIDRYRREQLMVLEPLEEHLEHLCNGPTIMDRHVESADLEASLAKLRAPEREALFLSSVEGYTAAEIAKLTGRPRGTVLSLIHRARQKMKDMLAADDQEEHAGKSRGQEHA